MTNSLSKGGVAGVAITVDPAVAGVTIATDSSGAYAATLPVGSYTLTLKKAGFGDATAPASIAAGVKTTKDVALKPAAAVAVSAGAAQTGAPGAAVSLKGTADVYDGSTGAAYAWTQTKGAKATISGGTTLTPTITLPNTAVYKDALVAGMKEVLDRAIVVGIDPHMLEAAEIATFKLEVTTSSGKYSSTVNVTATIPFAVSTGISNVPVGVPVLVQGKTQDAYTWTLAGPTGNKAALDSTTGRFPSFTPDVAGKYTLTEAKGAKVEVYAGTWAGVITGIGADGKPLATGCTACHNGTIARDMFTKWKASGHAEIFTQNIDNPAGHWSTSCASCHTVGYDTTATNNGWDEALAAEGWKVPAHGDAGTWASIVAKYPKTAKLANIQCENCHGPNEASGAHMAKPATGVNTARVSLSSSVCGSCHGEPLRHGRYQQWEESRHANYELAIGRVTSSSCVRCHNAQGFLAWIKQADMTKPLQGANGNATAAELAAMGITAETAQPVTCAVCHDPHDVGNITGEPNTAKVRIVDNTSMLPAGYQALGIGRGALCATCHNTRNALHEDGVGFPPSYSAPHTAAQADVLMGENAYFVTTGARAAHSYLADTCATCHMERTPPPAEFSYNLAGTNHAFKASTKICSDCHGAYDGGTLQKAVEDLLHELGKAMSANLLKKIPAQIQVKDYTPHTFGGKSYDVKSNNVTIDKINIASVEPTEPHGQQGFFIKLKAPASVTYAPAGEAPHTMSVSLLEVQLGDITTDGVTKLVPLDDVLVRAGWNYFLLEGDGSKGVHNPSFTINVINATIDKLK